MQKLVEERIIADPKICSGKPCIRGTRVQVSDILLALAEGLDERDILRNFRTIQKDDIKAALAYAYCITDGVQAAIGTSGNRDLHNFTNAFAKQDEIESRANDVFSKALEEQAAVQEEITQQKIDEIREKKSAEAEPKLRAPEKRAYDLEIEIEDYAPQKIFTGKDKNEQGIKLDTDNYIFELREDGVQWLIYSIKDGVEIDKDMKRNIKLHYNGKEAIFEGYLSTDRLHKVFIQKDADGNPAGRVL